MVSVLFTTPLVGVTDSQLPPEVVDAAAVNVRVAPGLMITTVCDGGAAAPVVHENDSELGVVCTGEPVAPEETFRMRRLPSSAM
jgi:hypothetical protein